VFETIMTVVGNIVTPLKAHKLENGDTVLNFRVAGNERRRNGPGGQWGPGDSLYLRVTCWRQLSENVLASLSVGDPVVVHGRLYTDEYKWEGETRTETRLEAIAVGPDLTRCTTEITRTRRKAAAVAEEGESAAETVSGETVERDESVTARPAGDQSWPLDLESAEPTGAASGPAAEHADDDRPSDDELDRLVAGAEAAVGV
jgi:single-strand DNA-binding protein